MHSHRMFVPLLVVGLGGLGLVAHAEGPAAVPAQSGVQNFSIKPDGSQITYHIVHKFHRVDGVSKRIEGRVHLQAGGPTQVAIRVPVESFDSGNVNRDEHMKEAVDAARFPMVELKAVADGVAMPTTYPATVQKTWKAQISFHGVTQPLEVPVTLRFESPSRVVATTSFQLSLDSFKV